MLSNLKEWAFRDTVVITVDELSKEYLHPERLRLQLANASGYKSPIDIGSIAYAKRGAARPRRFSDAGTMSVINSSFVLSRRNLIVGLLDSFVGLRDNSIVTCFRVMHVIINWLNDNGYIEVFSDAGSASRAYAEYTNYLNQCIHEQKFAPLHAAKCQTTLRTIIGLSFPDSVDYIIRSATPIARQKKNIKPPLQADVALYKDVCVAIAGTYSKFVCEYERFPCVVNVRDYEVVKFPSNHGIYSPFKKGVHCYNPVERRVATVEEYMAAYSRIGKTITHSAAERAVADAAASMVDANSGNRNYVRLQMAALAAKAYLVLFTLITGASPTELEQFTLDDALEIERSVLKKELNAVKFRARGRHTAYVLGRKEGLSLLRDYLELRKWILDGKEYSKLFFKIAISKGAVAPRVSDLNASSASHRYYTSISGVFVDVRYPKITAGKARKNKSSVEHASGISLEQVASSLNHTELVNVVSYGEATVEQQENEFEIYWGSVRKAAEMVRDRREPIGQTSKSTATGHCASFLHPINSTSIEAPTTGVVPNCQNQYGCLYCENYICHADEEDMHKLLSLQYVVEAVRNHASDTSHAESLYKDLAIRIVFVLDALAARSPAHSDLLSELRYRVNSLGQLTEFWEFRLRRYEDLGVVF